MIGAIIVLGHTVLSVSSSVCIFIYTKYSVFIVYVYALGEALLDGINVLHSVPLTLTLWARMTLAGDDGVCVIVFLIDLHDI